MKPLFASVESILVFAAIVLISAVSNWLKQRQERQQAEARDEGDPLRPRPAAPSVLEEAPEAPAAPRPRALDWQEELRRLLEGDERRAPPPRPAVPSVPARPLPVLGDAPPARPAPVLPQSPRPIVLAKPVATVFVEPARSVPDFEETAVARERGARVSDLAELRRQSAEAGVKAAEVPSLFGSVGRTSESARRLRNQLGNPLTARQAILASVILGPPGGLDPVVGPNR